MISPHWLHLLFNRLLKPTAVSNSVACHKICIITPNVLHPFTPGLCTAFPVELPSCNLELQPQLLLIWLTSLTSQSLGQWQGWAALLNSMVSDHGYRLLLCQNDWQGAVEDKLETTQLSSRDSSCWVRAALVNTVRWHAVRSVRWMSVWTEVPQAMSHCVGVRILARGCNPIRQLLTTQR